LRQDAVVQHLVSSLAADVDRRRLPAVRRAQVDALLVAVGSSRFYEVVAKVDPHHARAWNSMARVQQRFAAAEPKYDAPTRAYSESMRLTLQAALIEHFVDPAPLDGKHLYRRFLELHPTAFHQNGGWVDNLQIPVKGALEVLRATPLRMALETPKLLHGAHTEDAPTVRAAEWVRQARRAALAAPVSRTAWSVR
jgi:hypothetical protein